MGRLFGTDGIRGQSNTYPMTAETALRIGLAVAYHLRHHGGGMDTSSVVIGKDTRLSGYMIEQALTAGFVAMGMNVFLVGVKPTPAIAMITRALRTDISVVISASHNPYQDNGIKIFDKNGYKLSTATEEQLEALILDKDLHTLLVPPQDIGKVKRIMGSSGRYMEFVKNTLPKDLKLTNQSIVLDCANGAGYKLMPSLLYELGANTLTTIGNTPNGFNINLDCGSTHLDTIIKKVREEKADIGLALDGDGDRLMVVDEMGAIINGDAIMAILGLDLAKRKALKKNTVVGTVMSNMGLERFLREHDIDLVRTAVGDKHVIDHMRKHNLNFGGEQSGHIILRDYNTTGDGILAATHILRILKEAGKKASEILHPFTPFPQALVNIPITEGMRALNDNIVQKSIKEAEEMLRNDGRILVRQSGTEPLIRIMVEATNKKIIDKVAQHVVDSIDHKG